MEYMARCLAPLHRLTNLQLRIRDDEGKENSSTAKISGFSIVIAHNPDLTHFTFLPDSGGSFDLAYLFCEVPSDKPLRLEHVSVNENCTNFESLLPHIQHLSSYQFQSKKSRKNDWCAALSCANVFPPTIKVWTLDDEAFTYLKRHPRIISLSIRRSNDRSSKFKEILTKHIGTIQHLTVSNIDLTSALTIFKLQCASLRELVLVMDVEEWLANGYGASLWKFPVSPPSFFFLPSVAFMFEYVDTRAIVCNLAPLFLVDIGDQN
jgi:hypothetical protein